MAGMLKSLLPPLVDRLISATVAEPPRLSRSSNPVTACAAVLAALTAIAAQQRETVRERDERIVTMILLSKGKRNTVQRTVSVGTD